MTWWQKYPLALNWSVYTPISDLPLNDTARKNPSQKISIPWDLLALRNRLKWENTLYLKAVLARNILLMHWIFWSINECLFTCLLTITYYAAGAAPWNEHIGIIFLFANYFKKLLFHIFILLFWVYYPSWWIMFLFWTKQRKKQWYLLICFQFELVFIERIKVYQAFKVGEMRQYTVFRNSFSNDFYIFSLLQF